MTEQPKKKRGGKRPGAGCPPKDPADKVVKCYVSMTQAHHTATNGDRAGTIRRALDAYFKEQERVKQRFSATQGTVTITTSNQEIEPIIFTVKAYED